MRVGIIGAGMIGSTLAKLWVDAVMTSVSHRVIPMTCSRSSRNWERARPPALRRNRHDLVTSSCWQFRSGRSQASRAILRLR